MKLRKYIVWLFKFLLLTVLAVTCLELKNEAIKKEKNNVEKFLMMYKYPPLKNEANHKLNNFGFKNFLVTDDQLTIFQSMDESSDAPDDRPDTSKYLFTLRYEYMDLPCKNKAFLCRHEEFFKEYQKKFPEFSYEIPAKVMKYFGEFASASKNCIVAFLHPSRKVEDAAWICHPNIGDIVEFQTKISDKVYNSHYQDYTFVATQIRDGTTITNGIVELKPETFVFTTMQHHELMRVYWPKLTSYASTVYLKEKIVWKGSGKIPDAERCIKIQRSAEEGIISPDFYCVLYERNDLTMSYMIPNVESRFLAEMYTAKINQRFQIARVKHSLAVLASHQAGAAIGSNTLEALRNEVRNQYLKEKQLLKIQKKKGLITIPQFEKKLQDKIDEVTRRVCREHEMCVKAIEYMIKARMLPLDDQRQKIASDMENPYNQRMAPTKIKVDTRPSYGKQVVAAVAKVEGVKSYFTSPLPETGVQSIPNKPTIIKAFNTFRNLGKASTLSNLQELSRNCKTDMKNDITNIRRKLALMNYTSEMDIFFQYLIYMRNYQFGVFQSK